MNELAAWGDESIYLKRNWKKIKLMSCLLCKVEHLMSLKSSLNFKNWINIFIFSFFLAKIFSHQYPHIFLSNKFLRHKNKSSKNFNLTFWKMEVSVRNIRKTVKYISHWAIHVEEVEKI
jgi:hypothetical protein